MAGQTQRTAGQNLDVEWAPFGIKAWVFSLFIETTSEMTHIEVHYNTT